MLEFFAQTRPQGRGHRIVQANRMNHQFAIGQFTVTDVDRRCPEPQAAADFKRILPGLRQVDFQQRRTLW